MKVSEQDLTYQRELIWNNCVNILVDILDDKKYKFMEDDIILRRQKKFIDTTNIRGKNKYKSVNILKTYLKTEDKGLAEQVFWNTVRNKTS